MKHNFLYILSLFVLLSSCKTHKNPQSTRMLSAKKVIKSHYNAAFAKETIKAKIKTRYSDGNTTQSLTLNLRIKKDEVIWMSGTVFGITVAKVKITPTSVQYYEKIKHTYFDGDFSLISDKLGTNLNFQQLQNLLIGEAVYNLKDKKYASQLDLQAHRLAPKTQSDLFTIFYWINAGHYKLDKQQIEAENKVLTVAYPEYQEIDNVFFPKSIHIKAQQPNNTTVLDMNLSSVSFDKKLSFPFSIPKGYTKLSINK